MEPTGDRLSKRNLWTYTLASIGRDTAAGLFSGYLITFVLYTKNLTDAQFSLVSMAIVAARIFDGFNDPIMGNIIEVTRTKWGKFKPWIAIGMAGSAIVFYFSFSNAIAGWSYVAYFAVMFFIYSIVFTMNDIAYWRMIPPLASRKEDRDRLTSQAVLFAGMGAGITGIVVPTFTAGDLTIGGSAVTAYRAIAVIFIALFIGGQMITLLGVKEKPLPPRNAAAVNKVGIKTIVRTIRNNDQLSWCILIFLLATTGQGLIVNGLGINYIFFEFGYNGMLFTIFSALGAVATGAVMLFFTPISKRFKRGQLMRAATVSIVGGAAAMLLCGLLVPSGAGMAKFAALTVGYLFLFAGQSIYYLIIMICIANTVEYNEWKTGARAEGIIFSVRPFITKVGWAIINLMTLVIFLATGVRDYTNQIADFENAAARGMDAATKSEGIKAVLAQVPASKSAALLACMTVIPAVLGLASYYLYNRKYNITEERYERILAELKERENIGEGATV
ncbi:MAG: MFS transporter [Oscillospiraceae bacterium]|jgi:melibiose permease/lactose/raffinose/galactose permease|nr:MFS transporter [Oscillospiraceae bacterium]